MYYRMYNALENLEFVMGLENLEKTLKFVPEMRDLNYIIPNNYLYSSYRIVHSQARPGAIGQYFQGFYNGSSSICQYLSNCLPPIFNCGVFVINT